MSAAKYEIVPLSQEERDWLLEIYKKRLKYLFVGFLGNTLVLTFLSFTAFGFVVAAYINDVLLGGKETWLVDQNFTSGWQIKLLISAGIAAVFCLMSFMFRILPYKQDAFSGFKYKIPHTVVRKGYVPLTQQYFVTLEFSEHSFEVDATTYDNCVEGGNIFMGQAIKTGYIFSEGEGFDQFSF